MRKYLMTTLLVASIVGISWYGFAKGFKKEETASNPLNEAALSIASDQSTEDLNAADKRIVEELQHLLASVSGDIPLYIKGQVKATDPSDTAESHVSSPFVFFRKGTTLYYATETQTIVNDTVAYMVADHESQNILVMPARTTMESPALPLATLTRSLKEDRYAITRQERDGVITFSLVNEKHISCKEMRIKVKADTKALLEAYYRFTDLDHLEDNDWDKEMTISYSDWQTGPAATAAFKLPQIIFKKADRLMAATNFENYQITDLTNQ